MNNDKRYGSISASQWLASADTLRQRCKQNGDYGGAWVVIFLK